MASPQQGKSPDYRFTLANERTFLAWVRTALAFMAASVGIDQLATTLTPGTFRTGLVIVLSLTAAGLSCYAWYRWHKNEHAMRFDKDLPFPRLLLWLSGGLALCILVMLGLMI
ncbi:MULTISPECIES: YidH family protein [Edwardsiella]|uniref:DUF202 domain-containing protein n=2 Tax=Edwardsiella anguillarum TaxID=1821960 RepID=A0A076LR07_9GAMM|nr:MULTISPECIES: DUF202 domain-containing protein [Edwardsiella]AKM48623.1 membrane protein [Edwardsiella sp. EA181011]GAJ67900.1 inner membrane protein, DUF202 family [Edwardsiella piscicida]AIJ09102.1 Hypothetical protein ETEE_2668 [Edwardsiella anguillarum ET080813]AKR77051.1 DUF202 domain-containing protein [Edwardsiella sp. LADL05-105]KAB0587226.1 DUF202 domain-containing protein [Edwardsiella anguillarum]